MPLKERRKSQRVSVDWPAVIWSSKGAFSGGLKDISAGGAYIKCRTPLRRPEVNMYMSVSLLSPRIRAMGEVVRSDVLGSVNGAKYYGVGVRFVAISDTDREIISFKVAELLKHKTSE
jgi:hypothetical protein